MSPFFLLSREVTLNLVDVVSFPAVRAISLHFRFQAPGGVSGAQTESGRQKRRRDQDHVGRHPQGERYHSETAGRNQDLPLESK